MIMEIVSHKLYQHSDKLFNCLAKEATQQMGEGKLKVIKQYSENFFFLLLITSDVVFTQFFFFLNSNVKSIQPEVKKIMKIACQNRWKQKHIWSQHELH